MDNRQELLERLQRLHQELSQAEHVDPQAREMLLTITGDIDRLLAEEEISSHELHSATGQLRESLLRFETEHPRLAVMINHIADGLSSWGI